MNFPMEYPIFRFLYWLINTPGLGGLLALALGVGSTLSALVTLRWIRRGAEVNEPETYTYPTPTLLGHDHE